LKAAEMTRWPLYTPEWKPTITLLSSLLALHH
jgi:hypothetical protein